MKCKRAGIGQHAVAVFEARSLAVPGRLYLGLDIGRGLALAVVGEFFVLHAGDFDVDINAIQEGTRDPFLVAADHAVTAGALMYLGTTQKTRLR